MKWRKFLLHLASIIILVVPNLIYLLTKLDVIKDTHAIALTMVAMVVFSVIGIGVLLHFKFNIGVWITIIGAFVLALSNISYVAGVALLIEGVGITLDGYIFKPLRIRARVKELEKDGKSITYTRRID